MIMRDNLTRTIEEHANAVLATACGLMALFFISFLFVLSAALQAGATQSTETRCQGRNLIDVYKEEEPEKLAQILAEADRSLNGETVFWQIDKNGIPSSWLLGTMHLADRRIANLDGPRGRAFDTAETVIVENTDSLDPARASAAMLEHKDMTLYTDGTTLAERLDETTLAKLQKAAEARGIPFPVAQIMKPWLVATSVALPVCEIRAKKAGEPVLDALIGQRAREEGKTLVGLETIGEQFSAMHNLPESFHLEALKETLEMGNLAEDVMETMKLLYIEGRIGMIQPLTKIVSPKTSRSTEFAEFNESLIDRRNKVMAERSGPYLAEGGAFIAVGALHLPGKTGLVKAFRDAGYTLTPLAVK